MLFKALDNFYNVLKGLGGEKDPRTKRVYQKGKFIDDKTAEDLYTYNWLAAKVVDLPIDDVFREGRDFLISDQNQKIEIESIFKDLEIYSKLSLAMKWAYVFGGAGVLMVIEGDQKEPLDIESIKKGSLQNLIVLDKQYLNALNVDFDLTSINFGNPLYYQLVENGELIHYTRILKFNGKIPTIRQARETNYWGLSIYSKLFDVIADCQEVSNSIATLIYESNVDVYRIEGLNQLAATNPDVVTKRLEIVQKMKSIVNGVVLDSKDEYTKKTNTFTTLPEIADRFIQYVAGAAEIPVTRLLGISPAGMNATGESDLKNYFDKISALQENELRPKLAILDKVVLKNAGYNNEFEFIFNPLFQLTELEQADVDLKRAQRDQLYLDRDILTPLDVLVQLANEGTYASINGVRVEEEKFAQEIDWNDNTEDKA